MLARFLTGLRTPAAAAFSASVSRAPGRGFSVKVSCSNDWASTAAGRLLPRAVSRCAMTASADVRLAVRKCSAWSWPLRRPVTAWGLAVRNRWVMTRTAVGNWPPGQRAFSFDEDPAACVGELDVEGGVPGADDFPCPELLEQSRGAGARCLGGGEGGQAVLGEPVVGGGVLGAPGGGGERAALE